MKRNSIFFFCFLISTFAFAQENVTTLGLQFKPIFSVRSLNKDVRDFSDKGTDFTIRQPGGHNYGMIIRRGFKKGISIETGINQTKRKYVLTMQDSANRGRTEFSMISYGIPISLLVYIRLGDRSYMNTSFGSTIEMFPSEIKTNDGDFGQISYRKSLMDAALLANIGYEYRTKKSGYFYFGFSYHRPFRYIYRTETTYNRLEQTNTLLFGTYLTADIRYFFHEDPEKKKPKKAKVKKKKKTRE